MLYDISPPIGPRLAVWPGDDPPQRILRCDLAQGDASTGSVLHATVHLGAHADAPAHVHSDGAAIDECPLEPYVGLAQVVRVDVPAGQAIRPSDLPALQAPRLLVATGSYDALAPFQQDFSALAPEVAEHVQQHGVVLVGIDAPSVDVFHAPGLPAHHALLGRGILVLEGLQLAAVPAGLYELIALPLRLEGFDGSPVRAVLRSLRSS